jgi:hypothetical protein
MNFKGRFLFVTVLALVMTACGGNGGSPQKQQQQAQDTTPPVITLTGDNPQIIAVGEAYAELGATATDDRDGNVTASIVIDNSAVNSGAPGEYTVTYKVSDSSGNAAATVTRTVIYEDQAPPMISLLGDNPQIIILGNPYVELGATATDNVDGDLTASIVINIDDLILAGIGEYEVTYDVSDTAGNAADTVIRTIIVNPPVPVQAIVEVEGDIKKLIFSWEAVPYTDYYRLLENADGHSGFTRIGDDIPPDTMTASKDIAVHLFDWVEAQYMIEACNVTGCSTSDVVTATDVMLDTIGYFKASNTDRGDLFGESLALSSDGNTLAVGAYGESSCARQINGLQSDNSCSGSGAVYLFRMGSSGWIQEAYIKATNADGGDGFGTAVSLSMDGNTMVVGAGGEDSCATGVGGDQFNNSCEFSGAAYVFQFIDRRWIQLAYLKASNTTDYGHFGLDVSLSADGRTLAISSPGENSGAIGINGDQSDNSERGSGAAYVFRFDGKEWYQEAYIKASNTDKEDSFGSSLALSDDGNTLAIGAAWEDSPDRGVDAEQGNDPTGADNASGAVYVFRFDEDQWSQQVYIKASNADGGDLFGHDLDLSADGNTLGVIASGEDSISTVINGDESNNGANQSGAAYVFRFDGVNWYQQAYIKTFNSEAQDGLYSIALSGDGNRLVTGAHGEDSQSTGIGGDKRDNSARYAGAAYVFDFDGTSWQSRAYRGYVKATNTDEHDYFGLSVALSVDAETLAVSAQYEDGGSTGINGYQDDNSQSGAGAVYVY